jgi:hypothetical protein
LKFEDAIILLVEYYPCNNKEELLKKEGEYILNNSCVNKRQAGRTDKVWATDNKEKIKLQKQEYYKKNKEHINNRNKKYNETYNKTYYEKNKEKILQQKKEYYDKIKNI